VCSIPSVDVMCVDAPESTTQGLVFWRAIWLRAATRPAWSHPWAAGETWSGAKAVWACEEAPMGPWTPTPSARWALSRELSGPLEADH